MEKKKQLTEEQLRHIYQKMFSTPDGEHILHDIKTKGGYGKPSFTKCSGGKYDPLAAAINDGGKILCGLILEMMKPLPKITNKTKTNK